MKNVHSIASLSSLLVLNGMVGLTLSAVSACSESISLPPPVSISSTQPPVIALSGPITLDDGQLPDQPQGIRGIVQMLQGNQMPTLETSDRSQSLSPVSTRVWIFAGKLKAEAGPRWSLEEAQQHPRLVGWTMSDMNGAFTVGLMEGEYTLLAEYDNDLYLNSFLGDGSYASVQVTIGHTTEIEMINDENATF